MVVGFCRRRRLCRYCAGLRRYFKRIQGCLCKKSYVFTRKRALSNLPFGWPQRFDVLSDNVVCPPTTRRRHTPRVAPYIAARQSPPFVAANSNLLPDDIRRWIVYDTGIVLLRMIILRHRHSLILQRSSWQSRPSREHFVLGKPLFVRDACTVDAAPDTAWSVF